MCVYLSIYTYRYMSADLYNIHQAVLREMTDKIPLYFNARILEESQRVLMVCKYF